MTAHGHERHGRKEQEQTTGEDAFRHVDEEQPLFEIGALAAALVGEIADGVDRRGAEERARERQHEQSQRIERDPSRERRLGQPHPRGSGETEMEERGRDEQRAPHDVEPDEEGGGARERRHQHERDDHGTESLSVERRSASRCLSSRWMWNTMIPITKTATKTSSSTPISTSSGESFTSGTPNA